jgi:hypothetical protein
MAGRNEPESSTCSRTEGLRLVETLALAGGNLNYVPQ